MKISVEFSKLVIDKLIGAGEYGKVYKARRLDFPGTVAYKRINAVIIQPWEEAELKDEAKIHMQLDHPNIVKCFAVVFETENYGMILEFMKHGTAKNFLIPNNNLRSKMKIIWDVAAGMKYLHSIKPHAVIHGDLKLENVLISEDEIAKVCDFGFSRWKEYSKSHSVEAVPLGTVTHVPPERWRDSTVRKKEKFDVYSYGITMWEILTLKLPFAGEYKSALIQSWVEKGQRPNLGDIPRNVAENVVNLMVECWDGDKMKRPSFEDILTRLEIEL